jgi:predicted phosphoadenosine phosphosulfate sulfurtransferase
MYKRIRKYIKEWEGKGYASGIPDEAPIRLEQLNKAPSYRQICFAIMKNDITLQSLGFSRPKCQVYNELKRAELIERGVIKPDLQLKLF